MRKTENYQMTKAKYTRKRTTQTIKKQKLITKNAISFNIACRLLNGGLKDQGKRHSTYIFYGHLVPICVVHRVHYKAIEAVQVIANGIDPEIKEPVVVEG